jgi:riboflavin biosynthesis pyrimidine reductase
MRRLLPDPADLVDVAALYAADDRRAPAGRPWLLVNMIASVDGAIAVDGRSGGLAGPGDRDVFFALRGLADVILVGAGTARAEGYGPPRLPVEVQEARRARGQAPLPRLAVVTGRLGLEPDARLFGDSPAQRPLVLTATRAPADRRAALAGVAEVVDAGESTATPEGIAGALAATGASVVVCEGGPTLNGVLVTGGMLDELCLTLAPVLASGDAARAVVGPHLPAPAGLRLDRVLEHDGELYLRYLRP